MTVVALTGGVGAGKSTVTDVLRSLGCIVIDADVLARAAVEPGTEALRLIEHTFGSSVVDSSGHLDRAALADLVFRDPAARQALNDIVHPQVKRLYDEAVAEASRDHPHTAIVYAVPLLAEARKASEFDAIVVVHAPAAMRVERLQRNRNLSAQEAQERVDAQASDEERLALADSVLDASQDLETTIQAARQLYGELSELWPDRLSELSRQFPRPGS